MERREEKAGIGCSGGGKQNHGQAIGGKSNYWARDEIERDPREGVDMPEEVKLS